MTERVSGTGELVSGQRIAGEGLDGQMPRTGMDIALQVAESLERGSISEETARKILEDSYEETT